MVLDATETALEERHAREEEELEEKGRTHVDSVPAGKGKLAKIEEAKRETDQWIFEMKERHESELDELRARLQGGGDDAGTAEVAAPKATLSASAKKAAAAADAKAAAMEDAAKAAAKKDKAKVKRDALKQKEREREAEIEKEKKLNPPIPQPVAPEKGKGYSKGGEGGGGGGVCRAFAAGNCSYGDSCRFVHTK